LSGTGVGSITIPGGSSAGSLTIGANGELALGNGVVCLGFATNGGILTTGIGAKISGFTATGSTLKTSGADLTGSGDISGAYDTGVVLTYANTAYATGVLTTSTAGETALFAGKTDTGGAVTKTSSIL
jgi:hypothetical protein